MTNLLDLIPVSPAFARKVVSPAANYHIILLSDSDRFWLWMLAVAGALVVAVLLFRFAQWLYYYIRWHRK